MNRPIEEVYAALAQKLWPWDESKCRVCGAPIEQPGFRSMCKFVCWKMNTVFPPERHEWADAPPDLGCGNGMLMVLDAMLDKTFSVRVRFLEALEEQAVLPSGNRPAGLHALVVLRHKLPESVARAALAALDGQ